MPEERTLACETSFAQQVRGGAKSGSKEATKVSFAKFWSEVGSVVTAVAGLSGNGADAGNQAGRGNYLILVEIPCNDVTSNDPVPCAWCVGWSTIGTIDY